ncbi:hypothetical protein B0T18DRAFT_10405 [Schizothecium vesticola]|uniref:Uncharacterized protein n=1 Tax=Schizothecium vesticola TaxID=314040 RepID=A0AA40F8P5_9PEZI|nr:hypothetical protein B0T18DRAFT_10405 [Schizothecium vesticola]
MKTCLDGIFSLHVDVGSIPPFLPGASIAWLYILLPEKPRLFECFAPCPAREIGSTPGRESSHRSTWETHLTAVFDKATFSKTSHRRCSTPSTRTNIPLQSSKTLPVRVPHRPHPASLPALTPPSFKASNSRRTTQDTVGWASTSWPVRQHQHVPSWFPK